MVVSSVYAEIPWGKVSKPHARGVKRRFARGLWAT